MIVKIYLRSIVKDEKNHLAMFDTNRDGDIDNLTTEAHAGDKVIWKLDCCNGIKRITKIYSKKGEHKVLKSDPTKLYLCKGFQVEISDSAKAGDMEAYAIEYIPCDKPETKVVIDPYIRIIPPPVNK
jgi:hypothetical protein